MIRAVSSSVEKLVSMFVGSPPGGGGGPEQDTEEDA